MSEKPVEEMSFEEAIRELEEVVNRLDRGEVPLEESIRLYERGDLLKKRCEKKLREAEDKVALITTDGEGNATGTAPAEGL